MKKTATSLFLLLFGTTTFAQIPTTGLISSFSFNMGNANDETSTNDGTVTGATLTADRFGNNGMAYSLDGVDDFIDFGDVAAFQMGMNDFTISFWMYYDTDHLTQVIGKRQPISNYEQYGIIIGDLTGGVPAAGSALNGFLRTGGVNRAMNAGDLKGNWHHVVLSHDYDGETSLYVDNVNLGGASNPFTGNLDAIGSSLVVGLFDFSSGYYFNGKIDDIYIYNRLLLTTELTSLFNDPNPTLDIQENISNNIQIYPNPGSDVLNIEIYEPTTIIVVNLNGVEILTEEANNDIQLDLTTFAPGIYFIRTSEGETVKFIKE